MEQSCQMGFRLMGRARAKYSSSWSDFRLQPYPVFTWPIGRAGEERSSLWLVSSAHTGFVFER